MTPDKHSPKSLQAPVLVGIALLVLVGIGSALASGQHKPSPPAPPIAAMATASAPALPAPTDPTDTWIEWDSADGPKHFQVGTYSLDAASVFQDELNAPQFALRGESGAPLTWTGDGTSWSAAGQFAVTALSSEPSQVILLSSFSGGAHCCVTLTLAAEHGGAWRQLELGSWDGDRVDLPADLDGDGVKEFRFADQAFLYAFTSYAESYAPPIIHKIRDGQVRDVSGEPQYRPVFAAYAQQTREACEKSGNGACAAYVAAAARAGKLDEAWAVMLGSYDQAQVWELPKACRLRTAGACPTEAEIKFATYPEALQWFLGEHGYAPKVYVEPMRSSGPSFDCSRVTSPGENAVCGSPSLAEMDRALALVFARAMALSPDRTRLRSAQRTFLASRNATADVEALAALYQSRIEQLVAIE
jgi:uncharacterized protein YecT (DUF1311 family)